MCEYPIILRKQAVSQLFWENKQFSTGKKCLAIRFVTQK